MLRSIIAGVAVAFVAAALLLAIHDPGSWPMLAMALLVAFACLFERRYHAKNARFPDGNLVVTGERFVDPESGRVMTVWADPATGERHYVDAGDPPGRPV